MTKIVDESLTPVKMVSVPQHMLDKLEIARKQLYAMYPSSIEDMDTATLTKLVEVSDPMWKLANTKWKEVK